MALSRQNRQRLDQVNDEVAAARDEAKHAWKDFDDKRTQIVSALDAGSVSDEAAERQLGSLHAAYEKAADRVEGLQATREALWGARSAGSVRGGTATGTQGEEAGTWLAGQLQAATTTIDGGIGSAVAPVHYADYFFDALTGQSIGLASGFSVIETAREKLHVPRLTADAAAGWTAEGDELPLSDPDGDSIEVELRKLGAVSTISKEAVQSSEPSALALAEYSLARGLGLGLDAGFFEGTGAGAEILGIHNMPGIQAIVHGAALTDLDVIADAISALEIANAPRPYALAMHPSVFAVVRKFKDADGRPLIDPSPTADTPPVLFGANVWKSSTLDPTTIFAYSPAQIVAVRREQAELATDPFYDLRRELVGLRLTGRWALAVPNPQAVCVIDSITPA